MHGSGAEPAEVETELLGFAVDFAEDTTKTSWGVEFSWMANKLFPNSFEYDGLS